MSVHIYLKNESSDLFYLFIFVSSVQGIEPRTWCLLGKCCTIELHLHLVINFILNDKYHLSKSAVLDFVGVVINEDLNTACQTLESVVLPVVMFR